MDIRNLVFLGLLIFGAGSFGYGQLLSDGSTVTELIRNAVMSLVGVGGLTYNNFSWMKSKVIPADTEEKIHKPQNYEAEDFRCLVHLRNRLEVAGDKEGLDACAKLNTIIFNLHSRQQKVKENSDKKVTS